MNKIKTHIFLKEFYDCNSSANPSTVTKQKINCKYWSTTDDGCTAICSLKVLDNPNWIDCAKCEKRECVVDIPQPVPKLVNSVKKPNIENKKSFLQKAISYGKAEASQFINGKVSEEIYNKRKEICLGCDYKLNPVPEAEPIGWCKGGCGCKVGNPRAALSQKLYMPTITCPLKKFGPEVGQGFNISDAVDSIKGAATSINETIKSETEENK